MITGYTQQPCNHPSGNHFLASLAASCSSTRAIAVRRPSCGTGAPNAGSQQASERRRPSSSKGTDLVAEGAAAGDVAGRLARGDRLVAELLAGVAAEAQRVGQWSARPNIPVWGAGFPAEERQTGRKVGWKSEGVHV